MSRILDITCKLFYFVIIVLKCLHTILVSILQHFSKMLLAKASFQRTKRETSLYEDYLELSISFIQAGQPTSQCVLPKKKVMASQLSSLLPAIKTTAQKVFSWGFLDIISGFYLSIVQHSHQSYLVYPPWNKPKCK